DEHWRFGRARSLSDCDQRDEKGAQRESGGKRIFSYHGLRRRKSDARRLARRLNQSRLSFTTAGERTTIFGLAVIIYFAVDVQPGFLLFRREVFHNLHQVADHFLANPPHQSRAFGRYADHHLAAVVARY